jgi:hypothetical protein
MKTGRLIKFLFNQKNILVDLNDTHLRRATAHYQVFVKAKWFFGKY